MSKNLSIKMNELPLRSNKIVSEEFYKILGGCSKGEGCCTDDECCPGWYCEYFEYGQQSRSPHKVCLK